MDRLYEQYHSICDDLSALYTQINEYENRLIRENADFDRKVFAVDNELREKSAEYIQRISRVTAFIDIAKTHSLTHIEPIAASPFDNGKLSRLSVQINSNLLDDPYAVQLYTEASAQLMFLQDEKRRITSDYERRKKELDDDLRIETVKINGNISYVKSKVKSYLASDEFANFSLELSSDRCIFAGTDCVPLPNELKSEISIGYINAEFPIPRGMAEDFEQATLHLCNPTKKTVPLPVRVDVDKGTVIVAEYANATEKDVLGGIQNILLNVARYHGNKFQRILFVDPIRFNSSSLGCLAELSGTENAFIETVPTSSEDIRKKLKNIIAEINTVEEKDSNVSSSSFERSIYIFHDFPQSYDSTVIGQIQQLCVNAAHYGCIVILTHNVSSGRYASSDVYKYIQTLGINIKVTVTEKLSFSIGNSTERSFSWFDAPKKLPDAVKKVYIDELPTVDLNNEYSKRIGFYKNAVCKGNRQIERIAYGVDDSGSLQYLDFENSNFATFVCGAARSGKTVLLHTLITQIIQNYHPDDIEIWLIDFKMIEFSRYIEHLPPHVRYIVLDESPELVYDIIDRLYDVLTKRENIFKGKWVKLSEVPVERYMPALMVIIDEFSVMSDIVADVSNPSNNNYRAKLQKILAKGSALGLHFIFSSQGFTDGTRALTDFSKEQIQQRIALKTSPSEVKSTLNLTSPNDEETSMMDQLTVHHTLVRVPADRRGNRLLKSHVLYISDRSRQEEWIDGITHQFEISKQFEPYDENLYISKQPTIVDGNTYLSFDSRKNVLSEYLLKNDSMSHYSTRVYLMIGEARRLITFEPVEITNESSENILIIAPQSEMAPGASIILSIMDSLEMQKQVISVWTSKKSFMHRQLADECGMFNKAITDLRDICHEIKRIKRSIKRRETGCEFIVILGVEMIIADMEFNDGVMYNGRRHDELDLISMMNAGYAPSTDVAEGSNQDDDLDIDSLDLREDLKYVLSNGSRYGYHFIVHHSTVNDFQQTRFDEKIFRHKILFKIARSEAVNIVSSRDASIITELIDGHSFRYTNGLESLSYRPYLHTGLKWDGWTLKDGEVVKIVSEEDYLL